MRKARWLAWPAAVFALLPIVSDAGTQIRANGAAQVFAGAGYSNPTQDTVNFTVRGDRVGDNTPIAGLENGTRSDSLIDASARAPVSNSRTAVWTVDSSQPLTCATPASCGSTTIPLSKFRWTVTGGTEIASGTFSGAANQPLHTFQNTRYVSVYKTFFYVNDEIIPAGTYVGRVIYTVTMP